MLALYAGIVRAGDSPPLVFSHAEAARAGWRSTEPPDTGWAAVALPDNWRLRWRGFDGVVWYRLAWRQPSPGDAAALMIDYWNMAGAVYLNGVLLDSDPHLSEPLTRSWNTPRYWRLPATALRAGDNTLVIRVSGMSAYEPGLGAVSIGLPAVIRPQYERAVQMRRDLQLASLAVTATLGCFFFALWLMRRQESAYGWFSLMSTAWLACAWNQVATSPWPFASTHGWEVMGSVALLVYCVSFSIFVLRVCERSYPRGEAATWLLAAGAAVLMMMTPDQAIWPVRSAVTLAATGLFLCSCLLFLLFAWRSRRLEHRILSCCMAAFIAAGLHDVLTFFAVLDDNIYYAALTSPLLMVCMALVLSWRFVVNLRRIERFNDELAATVADARQELADTLRQRHELEVANARLGARLDLAHDLHDGLGGTLVGSIAALEHEPESIPPERYLAILKELRDDLRIIVDAASTRRHGDHSLEALLGPVRHRLTQLLDGHGIECRWRVGGADGLRVPTSHGVDLMRIFQEALTNVLKHSSASRVDIQLSGNAGELLIVIADNGMGFDPDAVEPPAGTGLRSMRSRVERLGGAMSIRSSPGATVVSLMVPLGARH